MNNKLDIVITMGGLGSRFRENGYNLPKYMITAKGKTLFEWSMNSLVGFKDVVYQYIFIALKDKQNNVKTFIKQKCQTLKITNYKIIILDKLTDGQATTALLAKKYWKEDNGLLIYNIDTYVEENAMNSSQIMGDGFIPCFCAEGNHWSFVRLNDKGIVVEIQEKQRISNNCTLGAYYFKSCKMYENLYNEFYLNKNFLKEKYVAPLYNHLLTKKGKIHIVNIDSNKVHVLGTPDELERFINE